MATNVEPEDSDVSEGKRVQKDDTGAGSERKAGERSVSRRVPSSSI